MKKGLFLFLSGLVSTGLLLSGCGASGTSQKETQLQETSETEAETIDFAALFREMEKQDYLQGDWRAQKLQTPKYYMEIADQTTELFTRQSEKQRVSVLAAKAGAKGLYSILAMTDHEKKETNTVFAVYDAEKNTTQQTDITEWIQAMGSAFVHTMSLSGDKIVVFVQGRDDDGNTNGLYACDWQDGALGEGINLYPVMEEYLEKPMPYYVLELHLEYEAASDQYYMISQDESQIVAIQKDGTLGRVFGEEKAKYSLFVQTSEGLQLFQAAPRDGNPAEIFYFDSEGEKKVLYQGEEIPSSTACMDDKGNVVYVSKNGQSLVEWRVLSGERTKIYTSIGEILKYPLAIARDENGEVRVYDQNSELVGMNHIVTAGEVVEAVIKVRSEVWIPEDIKKRLNNYSIAHPGVTFDFAPDETWDNRDITIGQIFTDIADGGGADILVLSRENLKKLVEKDCLLDLTDSLSQENREMVYPGLLQNGYIGDKMYMMTLSGSLDYIYVNKKVWNKDRWNVTEFMDTVEKANQQHALEGAAAGFYYVFPPLMLLHELTHDLQGEGLVNPEKGECFFDGEKFRNMMVFCKKYGKTDVHFGNDQSKDVVREMFQNGDFAVLQEGFGTFPEYSSVMSSLGEDYITIGWPDCGTGVMVGDMGIAANKNTPYRDLIEDIINTIVTKDYTDEFLGWFPPIRKDALDGRVLDATEWSEGRARVRLDSHTYLQLEAKPDGTSYVKEYIDLLSSVGGKDESLSDIRKIIQEEAESYFLGDRSLEDTLGVIQSRARLYLQEQL